VNGVDVFGHSLWKSEEKVLKILKMTYPKDKKGESLIFIEKDEIGFNLTSI
jgi:hypothetical protein